MRYSTNGMIDINAFPFCELVNVVTGSASYVTNTWGWGRNGWTFLALGPKSFEWSGHVGNNDRFPRGVPEKYVWQEDVIFALMIDASTENMAGSQLDEQAGHLRQLLQYRHTSLDSDWPHMVTQDPDQAFLDAYHYQLAPIAYTASLAHYHRPPSHAQSLQTVDPQPDPQNAAQ
ncbi:uncharacterized protein BDCG_06037 [Blastomyces dermatitidis ER-3]|uniref:Uncharacterized protein n=2 Tax=Ajellomyces dermatitidis TaxID=5039 RepID=F2T6C6_AJEDA|nr:uncharacterized protein BDCG_06037 [Blastomyces dermatitidis ER-3]EEQ90917.1 hypothetical protein BDCG_06037 [Blastomyces dermatitidis ER-3]EGE78740.2 hypothetical protein BDDG_01677 [Blastomyces dermatitidis ATCC 18188]